MIIALFVSIGLSCCVYYYFLKKRNKKPSKFICALIFFFFLFIGIITSFFINKNLSNQTGQVFSQSNKQETSQQLQSQNSVPVNPSKQLTYDINSLDVLKEWSQNNDKYKMEENNKIYMIKYPNHYIVYKGKIDGEYVYSYSTNAPDADVPQREYVPICTLYVSASADKLKIKAVSDTPKVTEEMYFTYNKGDKFIYNKTYDDDPLLHPDEINNIHGVVMGCTLSFKSHNYVKIFGHSKATRFAEKLDKSNK